MNKRFHKVKAHNKMLLLPAEHSGPGSLEECRGVIGMAMYCHLESIMLDAGVYITHPRVARSKCD
jgi:hypothetical protein